LPPSYLVNMTKPKTAVTTVHSEKGNNVSVAPRPPNIPWIKNPKWTTLKLDQLSHRSSWFSQLPMLPGRDARSSRHSNTLFLTKLSSRRSQHKPMTSKPIHNVYAISVETCLRRWVNQFWTVVVGHDTEVHIDLRKSTLNPRWHWGSSCSW
jgi:hypothetical protein